jgi:chromosome segregation ATPase
MFEHIVDKFEALVVDSEVLEAELYVLTDDLILLDKQKNEIEQRKYQKIDGEHPSVVKLETLQAELLELAGQTYAPSGKTKDERSADLLRHVKTSSPEYDEYQNRIVLAEYNLQSIKNDIMSKERQVTAVQKRLYSVNVKIAGYTQMMASMTAQREGGVEQSLAVMERRITATIGAALNELASNL